jgi:hypothetical protein
MFSERYLRKSLSNLKSSVNVLKCKDDTAVAEMLCTGLNYWTVGEQECEELTIMDLTSLNWGRDSSVGIATRFGLDGPGIEFRWGRGFPHPSRPAHPAPYTMGTGSFPGVKRPGRGFDHPTPSSPEVKERVELYLYSPMGLRGLF